MSNVIQTQPTKYLVQKILNDSANAKVLLVKRSEKSVGWEKNYVIKILNSEKSVKDCVLEFKSLQTIKGKYCAKVIDWQWVGLKPALISEYIQGVTLQQYIDSNI